MSGNSYKRCPLCKKWDFFKYHQCPPRWEVISEDDDGDWDNATVVHADYPEDAAAAAAEERDNDSDGGPSEQVLFVRPADGGGEVKRFEITFDYSVNYYASEEEDIDA